MWGTVGRRGLKAVGARERGDGGAVLSVSVSEVTLVRAFSVSKDPDGEVFDMRGPLCRQLEKLDVVPLDAVNQYCRGGKQTLRHIHTFISPLT